jgi:hypothetical protein
VSPSSRYGYVTVNGDTCLWADDGAEGAACAFVVGVVEDDGVVAGAVALGS